MAKTIRPRFVIGIDPASHRCGYAVMEFDTGKLLAYGTISNHSKDLARRIRAIRLGLECMMCNAGLLDPTEPDGTAMDTVLAYEAPYSGTGAGSAGRSGLQQVWIAIGMIITLPVETVMPPARRNRPSHLGQEKNHGSQNREGIRGQVGQ